MHLLTTWPRCCISLAKSSARALGPFLFPGFTAEALQSGFLKKGDISQIQKNFEKEKGKTSTDESSSTSGWHRRMETLEQRQFRPFPSVFGRDRDCSKLAKTIEDIVNQRMFFHFWRVPAWQNAIAGSNAHVSIAFAPICPSKDLYSPFHPSGCSASSCLMSKSSRLFCSPSYIPTPARVRLPLVCFQALFTRYVDLRISIAHLHRTPPILHFYRTLSHASFLLASVQDFHALLFSVIYTNFRPSHTTHLSSSKLFSPDMPMFMSLLYTPIIHLYRTPPSCIPIKHPFPLFLVSESPHSCAIPTPARVRLPTCPVPGSLTQFTDHANKDVAMLRRRWRCRRVCGGAAGVQYGLKNFGCYKLI